MWLAPTQIKLLTINEDVVPYAKELQQILEDMDLRVELDDRAESIGYKIREANGKYKIPMQLIIGKNEAENREVNVRRFGSNEQVSMKLDDFLRMSLKKQK